MNHQEKNNTYIIAGAIIIAGLLVAFGIFATGGNATPTPDENDGGTTAPLPVSEVTSDDHIVGSPNAEVALIEYSDTECPFCKRFHTTLQGVMEEYENNEVAWVYRHFPLEQLHAKARTEAHATECVAELNGNEAFWTFTNRIYEITPSNDGLDLSRLPELAAEAGVDTAAFDECQESERLMDEVDNDYEEAVAAGGRGTPYTVFVAQDGISDEEREAINTVFGGQAAGAVTYSDDGNRLAVGGALPENMVTSILNALLGE